MVACCDQMDQEQWLHNSNYYEIAQIMIKIAQNLSSLRIEAPEWYPNGGLVTLEIKINEDGKLNIENNDCKINRFNKDNRDVSNDNINNKKMNR